MDNLLVASSPHVKSGRTTKSVMLDVIIALSPIVVCSAFFFSLRALVLIAISVCSCVLFEYLFNRLMKRQQTIGDLSAVVTGLLLAFNLPVTVPIYFPIIGAAFAILVVKMLYGGIGQNVVNPAIAARIFLMVCFSSEMTTWVAPLTGATTSTSHLPLFATPDVVSTATPLSYFESAATASTLAANYSLLNCFLGTVGGCLGETSAVLLLLGGLYLIYKKIISPRIPLSFLGTIAIITFLFPITPALGRMEGMLYQLLSGGLMLSAFFMATDYTTSPTTPTGRIIFGVGCGLITVLIRYFGAYPEGVSFAILLMNFFVWYIDHHTIPKTLGGAKRGGKTSEK